MIALYDHIIALLVAGMTILLLWNVQQRAQRMTVERTMMYQSKNELLEVATMLERDLSNAGYGTSPVEPAVLYYSENEDGITDSLIFWGLGANGKRTRIAYGVRERGTADLDGEERTLYHLQRYERRGSQFEPEGQSAPTLTRFGITLLDNQNQETEPDKARRFRARYAVAVLPKFDSDTYLRGYRQLHWGITLDATGAGAYVKKK